jgi:hypothetical protein
MKYLLLPLFLLCACSDSKNQPLPEVGKDYRLLYLNDDISGAPKTVKILDIKNGWIKFQHDRVFFRRVEEGQIIKDSVSEIGWLDFDKIIGFIEVFTEKIEQEH